jgi:phosphatidylglycerol---prolipoprotein diacylglyceryl transferase
MQFPLNISIGNVLISTHLVCEIAGIFIGYRFYKYLRKHTNDSISDMQRLYIFMALCAGALIGSRLIGTLEDLPSFLNTTNKWQYIFSNKTIVGGFLFGLFAVEGIKKHLKINVSSGDLMVYPILLGLVIGRIGCFCEGLNDGTIGKVTASIFGINFGDGLLRHPLPLYEICFLLVLWFIIFRFNQKKVFTNGGAFKLFLMSYFVYRFGIEFLKESPYTVLQLNVIQWTCLVGICYYYSYFIHPKKLIQTYA